MKPRDRPSALRLWSTSPCTPEFHRRCIGAIRGVHSVDDFHLVDGTALIRVELRSPGIPTIRGARMVG